jgi:hypothetical protein
VLFLQEINSGEGFSAAGILDRWRHGKRNNSGTNSPRRLTKSNHTRLDKIAYLAKTVNQQDVIPSPAAQGARAAARYIGSEQPQPYSFATHHCLRRPCKAPGQLDSRQ